MPRKHEQRQSGRSRAGRQSYGHRTQQALAGGVHVYFRLVALAQDELGVSVEHLASFRRCYPAFGSKQQLLLDLALERRQLLAERRLRHVQDVGGLCETADIDDFHEILQAPQVHGLLPPGRCHLLVARPGLGASKNSATLAEIAIIYKKFISRKTELVLALTPRRKIASRPDSMIEVHGELIRIAERVRRIKPSPSTAAADRANELRRQGRQIVSLVVGEPDFDTPAHIRQAAANAMEKGATRYTLMAGTVDLRRAIAAKLERENGLTYALDEIMVRIPIDVAQDSEMISPTIPI
ncbi:hypothetical protein ACVWWO_008728 [Bradyrhizobium sp. F1.13.1]